MAQRTKEQLAAKHLTTVSPYYSLLSPYDQARLPPTVALNRFREHLDRKAGMSGMRDLTDWASHAPPTSLATSGLSTPLPHQLFVLHVRPRQTKEQLAAKHLTTVSPYYSLLSPYDQAL